MRSGIEGELILRTKEVVMLEVLLFSAAVSITLSLLLTPPVIRLAYKLGAVDKPDPRKIHKLPTPRLGGLATFGSFMITLVVIHYAVPGSGLGAFFTKFSWLGLSISLVTILILGACDDMWTLKPGQKFLVQFVAGALVYVAGFKIGSVTNPFTGGVLSLGLFSLPITVIWVVGITNAFNLIDGLDGLAAGISAIAGLTIAAIALLHGDQTTAEVAIILVGAVLGFLRYNFNPAKVFWGDSGSLFVGFMLAVLSINSSTKGTTAFSMIVPILALGVPVMDTSLAMLRRILRSFLPGQSLPATTLRKLHSMFLPDRRHIHHQLLARGLSQRDAVFVLYVVSCAFGICAFLVTAGSLSASLILGGVGILAVIAVRKLGYREMALLRNGILLRLYKKAFMKHVISQVLLDVAAVFVSFFLAWEFSSHPGIYVAGWRTWSFYMIAVCLLQLLAFLLGGVYRRSITLMGLGDFLQMLKAALVGAAIGAFALLILPVVNTGSNVGMFTILDFYFLSTLVIGSRVAFRALNYVFGREVVDGGKKAIIYGADGKGLIALQSLLAGEQQDEHGFSSFVPVGFLDDDPRMEGKYLDGYPVFGGHWKLEGLMNRMNIGEIVLARPNIDSEVFLRIRKIADRHNVPIRVSEMRFDPVDVYATGEMRSELRKQKTGSLTPKAA